MKFLIISLTLLFSAISNATVVMVDLNFSPREREAALEAAKARGEDLIVIPTLSNEVMKKIKSLQKSIEAAGNNEKLKGERVQAFEIALSDLHLSNQNIGKVLSDTLKNTKTPITSLIVSGHHGGERFSGDMGRLEESDITKAFKDNPDQAKNIASVYLWGCYTGTKKQVKSFKELKDSGVLPNLQVMAGFLLKAPKEDKGIDTAYLVGMMKKEKEAMSISGIQKVLAGIKGINESFYAVTSFCGKGAYVSVDPDSRGKVRTYGDLAEAVKCDEKVVQEYKDGPYQTFKKYLLAEEEGYDDIPADAAEMKPGTLRDVYNQGRELEQCFPVNSEYYANLNQKMIPLMYMDNIIKHFQAAFATETEKVKAILKNLGKSDLMPNLATRPRKKLLAQIKAFQEFVNKILDKAYERKVDKNATSILTPDEKLLSAFSGDLYNTISMANPTDAVPWIEDTTPNSVLRHGSHMEFLAMEAGQKSHGFAPNVEAGSAQSNDQNNSSTGDKGDPSKSKKDSTPEAGAEVDSLMIKKSDSVK